MTESTGIESVDAVVSGLVALDELPVAEHVAVFERAHESLRTCLTAPASGSPVSEPSRG
jgi:proline racemase